MYLYCTSPISRFPVIVQSKNGHLSILTPKKKREILTKKKV